MLEKLVKIQELDKEIIEKENQKKIVELQEVVNNLLDRKIEEKLNELIESGKYAFDNRIMKRNCGSNKTDDEKKFIANRVDHNIGFEDNLNSISIYGGGCCGNIGIKYCNDTFYATDENGKNGIPLHKFVALFIYNQFGIDKVVLVKKWVENFSKGIDTLMTDFENRIDEILIEKQKKINNI